jgi:predicted PurR-regulated permease PerM
MGLNMQTSPERRIILSFSNVIFVLVAIASALVIWQLRGLFLILMVAIVLAATIAPIVDWAEQWRIPRWMTVVTVYFSILAGIIGVSIIIGPTVIDQIERLVSGFPAFLSASADLVEIWIVTQSHTRPEIIGPVFDFVNVQELTNLGISSLRQLLIRSYGFTTDLVSAGVSLILAIFLSGYMLSDSRTLLRSFTRLFPKPWDIHLAQQIHPISRRIGSYIRGRALVSALLGVVITLGLSALGLSEYSLGLGAIASVTNLIPFIGPLLGAGPALIVAISQGVWTFLWVLGLFVIVQNLETYVLDPLLVGSSVGVHPFYQLLAVLGGTQVLGIVGALIVPPWIAGAAVLLENLYLKPKFEAEQHTNTKMAPSAEQIEPNSFSVG